VLPATAPVSASVRLRVDGMLAGAYCRPGSDAVAAHTAPGPLVVWASQTGNAEEFAARLAQRLEAAGAGARLVNMDDCALSDLQAARHVLVVTSTFGDGGPPDNGADFWDRLASADAPQLRDVRYAVLGIGDRSYDNFCGHAKSIDARLGDLGATQLIERAECEAYDEEPMAQWADQITKLLSEPVNGSAIAPAPRPLTKPRVAELFTRARPVAAPLSRNLILTALNAEKEVRQFCFDLSEHDVSYAVGDSLGVYAPNHDAMVTRWLAATGLPADDAVEIDGTEMALREALTSHYDICRVTPDLLDFIADACTDKAAVKTLRASRPQRDSWLVGRNGIDIVEQFPVRADTAQWRDALVRLTPRQYSISNSPLVSPHEVHLTVSIVRYRGPDGTARGGVCSTFLADRAASSTVPVFLQRSPHFRLPEDPSTPMVMVGPGTGIAPFRGFLQERRTLGHTGRNWLFFGDRRAAENFYYRTELEDMFRDGFLTRLDLAFSRDQPERIYVQHKMIDSGAEIWRWLQDGAHFYVCGDASRMAKDVDAALTRIIKTHGGMSDEDVRDYKRELVAAKRYVRDVY
jgi:sulfite reductase (NADPH) flavoprotein alpha-component